MSSAAFAVEVPQQATPSITAKAREWFFRFRTGTIDRSQLSSAVNAQLSKDMIQHEQGVLQAFGPPKSFVPIPSSKVQGLISYNFIIVFEKARVVESIAFERSGKIAGIDFQPFVPTR